MGNFTQDQFIILSYKVVLLAALITIAGFVIQYTWYAPWWKNSIGRTVVWMDIALFATLTAPVLSLFFMFSRITSRIAAWIDVASLTSVSIIMMWRMVVWYKEHKRGS